MKDIKIIFNWYFKIPRKWRKFLITAFIFTLYLFFFDKNNFFVQSEQINKLHQLEDDKEYYIKEINKDKKRIIELTTDPTHLEKFAREKYLMKRDDEDVFVIIFDEDTKKESTKDESGQKN